MPSARQLQERRERIEWERQYEAQQREAEDTIEYQRYLQTFKDAGLAGKAWDVEPLPFSRWRELMPSEESNPAIRGAIASHKHLINTKAVAERDILAGSRPLEDVELQSLGFDLDLRIDSDIQLSTVAIRATFEQFSKRVPEFDRELHYDAVCDFLKRNRLEPTLLNVSRTFALLLGMGIVQRKPEPETPNPEVNQHGVNLRVERDPELEAQQRRKEYRTKVVVTDPRTGEGFTQYQLDRTDSETYRRLVFGEFAIPRVTDVIYR